ncbi:hypothetical protein JXB31_01385 [Candidatus Woesearchaeota archaeon]|nr:hypothetical protein [Candidatus Woesearchaeota archaeon]
MKLKLRDMLDSVEEEDLYKLQHDLAKGGFFLKKLIDSKLKDMESAKKGYCITCGEDLRNKPSSYTLIFGPEDFRKKAVFCEIDCLEYFISSLKKHENSIKGCDKNALQKDNETV